MTEVVPVPHRTTTTTRIHPANVEEDASELAIGRHEKQSPEKVPAEWRCERCTGTELVGPIGAESTTGM